MLNVRVRASTAQRASVAAPAVTPAQIPSFPQSREPRVPAHYLDVGAVRERP